ncbi:hypothetical protein G7Z17_g1424 [Cylindrodendrum hubeiense]|uniref:Uracil permease n=1 Tax=Cylindrodendrum hubeiense TaxID=595255 RepID=A0A9P5HEW7_9HYPO|nr:hypothetical protein G7Z17_g1424 [Cylindrodendrum hubeiense]
MGLNIRLPRTFRSLLVNEDERNSRWANNDILPVPYEDRKYTWQAYFGYWFTVGLNTTVWQVSLCSGRTCNAGSAIGGILVGSVLSSIVAVLCAEPGILYHLGFPMLSRSTFGMYGSFFVIILKCFVNFTFFGIQSYWGGQAIAVMLSAIFPSFAHMENTLPESAGIETQQLIGFVIFIVIFTSLMFIHPTKLQPILFFSQIMVRPSASLTGLGISTTSAVKEMYGEAIWNPISLLEFLQKNDYSATTRAGTFFAGTGFFVSQMSVNLVQNSIACGMDLASLWPKYIDVTRGSLIMCFVGYLIQPWRFVEQPGVFISVLSAFGMFISPLAGIGSVDFWIVRQRKWKVPDLYIGNSKSIYWYTFGWNWRAMAAWCIVIWPSFPGFVASVTSSTDSISVGWIRAFQVSWIIGFCGGGATYYLITLVSPPPGGKPYQMELLDEIEGVTITRRMSSSENVAVTGDISTDIKHGGTSHTVDIEKHVD